MIDTVRFSIRTDNDTIAKIKNKSIEFKKYDNAKDMQLVRIFNKKLNLGSYDSNVNVYYNEYEENVLKLEFSVPKFYYGHNIYLIYFDEFIETLENVQKMLYNYFGQFPTIDKWVYQRIDVCYSWKAPNQEFAHYLLEVMRARKMPRKVRTEKPTSFMDVGGTYSVKWYLKRDEFKVHDFTKLKRESKYIDFAYNLLDVSEGVIRFEATIRKQALNFHFGNKITPKTMKHEDYVYLLLYYFQKFMGLDNKGLMSHRQVYNQLSSVYGKKRARRLYMFYRLFHSGTDTDMQLLKETYDSSSIRRQLRELKNADVGILVDNPEEFDFNIPSVNSINTNKDFENVVKLLKEPTREALAREEQQELFPEL